MPSTYQQLIDAKLKFEATFGFTPETMHMGQVESPLLSLAKIEHALKTNNAAGLKPALERGEQSDGTMLD